MTNGTTGLPRDTMTFTGSFLRSSVPLPGSVRRTWPDGTSFDGSRSTFGTRSALFSSRTAFASDCPPTSGTVVQRLAPRYQAYDPTINASTVTTDVQMMKRRLLRLRSSSTESTFFSGGRRRRGWSGRRIARVADAGVDGLVFTVVIADLCTGVVASAAGTAVAPTATGTGLMTTVLSFSGTVPGTGTGCGVRPSSAPTRSSSERNASAFAGRSDGSRRVALRTSVSSASGISGIDGTSEFTCW